MLMSAIKNPQMDSTDTSSTCTTVTATGSDSGTDSTDGRYDPFADEKAMYEAFASVMDEPLKYAAGIRSRKAYKAVAKRLDAVSHKEMHPACISIAKINKKLRKLSDEEDFPERHEWVSSHKYFSEFLAEDFLAETKGIKAVGIFMLYSRHHPGMNAKK